MDRVGSRTGNIGKNHMYRVVQIDCRILKAWKVRTYKINAKV